MNGVFAIAVVVVFVVDVVVIIDIVVRMMIGMGTRKRQIKSVLW